MKCYGVDLFLFEILINSLQKHNTMKTITAFLISGLFFQNTIAQEKLPDDILASINNRIASGKVPSIVVGIVDKNVFQYHTFGNKTIDGDPVDEHTIYEIGSITKTFTGLILAKMAVNGELKVDDPAQRYLPQSVALPVRNGKQITLGHLADHTSGIPRRPTNYMPKNMLNPFEEFNVEHLYDFLNNYLLTREIGSTFEYSNVGAGLLGHILSLKTGTPYEDLMIKEIASLLALDETRISFTSNMEQNKATGYLNGKAVPYWDFDVLAGAGAIRSSLHDMLRFVGANIGIIKSELLTAMQLAHQPRHNKGAAGRNGLGWVISQGAEGDVIWHNGVTGGFRSFIGFVKETGKGVVVMTNCNISADDIGMRLLNSNARLSED